MPQELHVELDRQGPQPHLRIDSGALPGWARIHVALPAAENQLLGLRFVLRVEGRDPQCRIKPFLVSSVLDSGARQEIPGAPATPVFLDSGQWYALSGAFVCGGQEAARRFDAVLDLPKGARLTLAAVEACWLPLEIGPQAAPRLQAHGACPLSGFTPQPIADPAALLDQPAVFAGFAALQDDSYQGGLITECDQVYSLSGSGSGAASGPQAVALDRRIQILPDIHLRKGFHLPIAAGQSRYALPRLVAAPQASEILPLAPAVALGQPPLFRRHLHVSRAHIQDYGLDLQGIALNPLRPGMPVRLRLRLGDQVLKTVLASAPAAATAQALGEDGFQFALRMPVPEHLIGQPLQVEFIAAGDLSPVQVPVTIAGRQAAAPQLPSPVFAPENAEVTGQVESWTRTVIEGWAMVVDAPDAPVELALYLDGKPFAYSRTSKYRKDVQKQHGGAGHVGFVFDIPPNASVASDLDFEVRLLGHSGALKAAQGVIPAPAGYCETSPLPVRQTYVPKPKLAARATARISVVVLNRNGETLLQEMFQSCAGADLTDRIEWIIVDHDSQDGSEAVCDRLRDAGADIRFVRRKGNYSFSESNNFGARMAQGDVLLFANNDLLFPQSFGKAIRQGMRDANIGVMGVRLLDHVESAAAQDLEMDQHLGVFFDPELHRSDWLRPFEARRGGEAAQEAAFCRVAAVTGAFFALRRDDFFAVGGFDESYSYGLEDVDLCLKIRTQLGKEVVCANEITVIHHRGFSRQKDQHAGIRRRRNNEIFNRRWGPWLRQEIKQTITSQSWLWTGRRPVFAFAVSDVGDKTSAGEFYTALEMGRALQKQIPCHIRYIPEQDWYDLTGVDVVVAMVSHFDLGKVKQASPWLTTINWMRQWFDRWAEHPATPAYDYLFASSQRAVESLEQSLSRKVGYLPIAAGSQSFEPGRMRAELQSDYCFSGSRFGPPRELEFQLKPETLTWTGKVFGYNWEGSAFEDISAGPVAYSEIPDVYASTKIVLDDANIATKGWGSCNSRVFDAMAAGTLLVSNGRQGVQALFGDLVPTFDSAESLTQTLEYWLSHEDERQKRVRQLQQIVRDEHSYDVRAKSMLAAMPARGTPRRIAIKCAARHKERAQWGDYHYAQGLATALRQQGFTVRVDCRESWDSGLANSDDVVIVLRGLVAYKPRPHQQNIMWLISHPDDVTPAEMRRYDHVYVASEKHADILSAHLGVSASFMPQCTDTTRFSFDPERIGRHPDRNLYVANSRGIFRDPVRWAVQHELPIEIYGVGWEPFISDERYRGQLVPNEVLAGIYASSQLVICDHWEDMCALGYVSNRVFDVLACGGRLIVDRVQGLAQLVPDEFLEVYDDEADFVALIRGDQQRDNATRARAAEWVATHHSFDARAREFKQCIEQLSTAIDSAVTPALSQSDTGNSRWARLLAKTIFTSAKTNSTE